MEINGSQAQELTRKIIENIHKIIIGKDEAIELIMIALAAKGHVLIEDVPGIGKTTLVHALAKSINCDFKRIQFTPDLMPSDVTGFNLYNPAKGDFVFQPGAVMANIILADEINRTSPKTQSALLEAMQESQVTIDSVSYTLDKPYMVLATQNPIEHLGTYSLPEAQLDRFMMKIGLGYPTKEEEIDILSINTKDKTIENLSSVCHKDDILYLQKMAEEIFVKQELLDYCVEVVRQTREQNNVLIGASPRASQMLIRASKARALLKGRDYVLPEDIKVLAINVLSHRLVLKKDVFDESINSIKIIQSILDKTPIKLK